MVVAEPGAWRTMALDMGTVRAMALGWSSSIGAPHSPGERPMWE